MNITRILKIKKLNGELDNIDEFESNFLRLFDALVEDCSTSYITYKKPIGIFTKFSINLYTKIFWYEQDFMYWDILKGKYSGDINKRISLFLYKYLDLKEFKMQVFYSGGFGINRYTAPGIYIIDYDNKLC